MSRTLFAGLLASALVLNAWSATAGTSTIPTQPAGTSASVRNQSALPPGGAAGIKKAQGIEGGYWREAALVIGAFVVIFILMGINDDDDEATTTTGTSLH